jgi:hypothetical protein
MYRAADSNGDGDLDDAGEITLFFNAGNAAGTLGPMNPTCLDVCANGVVLMGDQINQNVYRFCDADDDGDAQDAGESIIFADGANLSGVSFAFPTGAAFDSLGRAHVTNAGNALGNDGIYRLIDLNGDGDAQDAGEVTEYVGAPFFGPGNGAFSPQEIFFDANDILFMHNSSSGLLGVFRFRDLNASGRADDAGEANTWWDASNASGITPAAGFAIEPDRGRTRSLYILQTAPGAVDQLVRLTDVNDDGDAQDAGEAVIAWSTAESGFTAIDIVCLNNGDVLITDNSTKRVIRLHDADANGDFLGPAERSDYFTNPDAALGDVRQMSVLPIAGDVNRDGVRDMNDVDTFGDVLMGLDLDAYRRLAADANGDGQTNGRDAQRFTELLIGP